MLRAIVAVVVAAATNVFVVDALMVLVVVVAKVRARAIRRAAVRVAVDATEAVR